MERSPPTTEQNQPPKSPSSQVRQPQQTDAQKKKELLLKEQCKLKQTQLSKKTSAGAPAYISVTPPAKDQHTASTQSPAPASSGTVAVVQRSPNLVRLPPSSTLTPKQGLLITVQSLESNLGWEALPMHTLSGNTFGSDKKFAMDWASADTGEVSSQKTAPMHPSSSSMVAKTLHELQIATLKASQTATVSPKTRTISP